MKSIFAILLCLALLAGCNMGPGKTGSQQATGTDTLVYSQEKHLRNMRQLTFGGSNAEAYFSFDSKRITFQSNNPAWGVKCSHMDKQMPQMISTGLGRTTCSYFLPGDTTILYASTHAGGPDCPPEPEHRTDGKYVWPVYSTYDIYVADMKGNIIDTLTHEPGYDAEATISNLR